MAGIGALLAPKPASTERRARMSAGEGAGAPRMHPTHVSDAPGSGCRGCRESAATCGCQWEVPTREVL